MTIDREPVEAEDLTIDGSFPELVTFEDVANAVTELRRQQAEILLVLKEYGEQLVPALNGMKNSPIGKMLGM